MDAVQGGIEISSRTLEMMDSSMDSYRREKTSEELIGRVEGILGEVPVIQELIREYRIAVAQALKLEDTVHRITKTPRHAP